MFWSRKIGHFTSGAQSVFWGIHFAQSLVFCVVFCWSLFVYLSCFAWSLYCLLIFCLRLLITPLVSSNSSYLEISENSSYRWHMQLIFVIRVIQRNDCSRFWYSSIDSNCKKKASLIQLFLLFVVVRLNNIIEFNHDVSFLFRCSVFLMSIIETRKGNMNTSIIRSIYSMPQAGRYHTLCHTKIKFYYTVFLKIFKDLLEYIQSMSLSSYK